MTELCACGDPLHYVSLDAQRQVQTLTEQLGPLVTVELGNHAWKVPRHYIALHGLVAAELPALARRYGWEQVK